MALHGQARGEMMYVVTTKYVTSNASNRIAEWRKRGRSRSDPSPVQARLGMVEEDEEGVRVTVTVDPTYERKTPAKEAKAATQRFFYRMVRSSVPLSSSSNSQDPLLHAFQAPKNCRLPLVITPLARIRCEKLDLRPDLLAS